MTDKTVPKEQLKRFRIERFMDSAEEPDNLTPPKKQKEIVLNKRISVPNILPTE
jgi:hypothetical protein